VPTKIEWAEETWNPVTGCTPVSAGCDNCYARRMAIRLRGRCGYSADDPFKVTLHPDRLEQPLRWWKPRRVFVCSMGDLFHGDVPEEFIDEIFAIMALCPQHTFIVLTKRPERIRGYMQPPPPFYTTRLGPVMEHMEEHGYLSRDDAIAIAPPGSILPEDPPWPLPNVWLGVTAENQEAADERIPILLEIPAAVRFVSVEPMLGPVALDAFCAPSDGYAQRIKVLIDGIDWVICGGESGPSARPMHPDWARSLRDQCQSAGVPFFFKQWGEWYPDRKGVYDARCAIFGDTVTHKIGKKAAGRLLDGREWNEYPEATP